MKTILLIIAIAGILFFAYRKVADYYYKKGWTEAHEKFRDKEYWDSVFIGDTPLINVTSGNNTAMGNEPLIEIGK